MRHLELAGFTRLQRSLHPAWPDENLESDLVRALATVGALLVTLGTSSLIAVVLVLVL